MAAVPENDTTNTRAEFSEPAKKDILLELVTEHAQFATICTEPAMIALAAAKAREILGAIPDRIEVSLSPGVLKNALSAGLPCGDRKGPDVAAALGSTIGISDDKRGLQILAGVSPGNIEAAYEYVDLGKVSVSADNSKAGVYACVTAIHQGHVARVVISGSHTNITDLVLDGKSIYEKHSSSQGLSLRNLKKLGFEGLYSACMDIDPVEIKFLLHGAESDLRLALKSGEKQACRHSLNGVKDGTGASNELPCPDLHTDDLMSRVHHRVLGAISARMGGTPWPVLTSGGSGNQGIMLAVPVLCAAESLQVGREDAARALYLGHAINLYVKSYMGSISCVCGAVSAGAGVAAAISWLLSRDIGQVEQSINIVLSALYGMICDGAKASCALKGSVGAIQGLNAAFMVYRGLSVPEGEGIIGSSIEETLDTVGYLNEKLFSYGDKLILDKVFVNR
jgi:L-cysteine desulfidase